MDTPGTILQCLVLLLLARGFLFFLCREVGDTILILRAVGWWQPTPEARETDTIFHSLSFSPPFESPQIGQAFYRSRSVGEVGQARDTRGHRGRGARGQVATKPSSQYRAIETNRLSGRSGACNVCEGGETEENPRKQLKLLVNPMCLFCSLCVWQQSTTP
uniref:Putative secreted protein n=1 Tax=Anopheles darlingi TaxID=43151 RepID=A0A2M4DHF2_ANODA